MSTDRRPTDLRHAIADLDAEHSTLRQALDQGVELEVSLSWASTPPRPMPRSLTDPPIIAGVRHLYLHHGLHDGLGVE
jgi:hypothetical protein